MCILYLFLLLSPRTHDFFHRTYTWLPRKPTDKCVNQIHGVYTLLKQVLYIRIQSLYCPNTPRYRLSVTVRVW
jgi:hypothetical protein